MKRKHNKVFKRILYPLLYGFREDSLKKKYGCRVVNLVLKHIEQYRLHVVTIPQEVSDWYKKIEDSIKYDKT